MIKTGNNRRNAKTGAMFFAGVLLAAFACEAGNFTNWPTYASAPLTNWPKASEYDALVEDLTMVHKALAERSYVLGVSTNSILPATNGTRPVAQDVGNFKSQANTLITDYVDDTQYGNFQNTNVIPKYTVSLMLDTNSLPSNYFSMTPSRLLNDVAPEEQEHTNGMPGLKNIVQDLKWTTVRNSAGPDNATNRTERVGSSGDTMGLTYQQRLENCRVSYSNETTNVWSVNVYYETDRWRAFWNWWGFALSAARIESRPKLTSIQCPAGVTFGWENYLKPAVSGTNDWYSWHFTNDTLRLWDSGTGASSNTITANLLTDNDTTFPYDLAPSWTNTPSMGDGEQQREGVTIDTADWLLKWNFQYGD